MAKNIQAFPLHEDATEVGNMEQRGMTLRDYFAAKALHGLMTEPKWVEGQPSMLSSLKMTGKLEDSLAESSYMLADAMLKARGE